MSGNWIDEFFDEDYLVTYRANRPFMTDEASEREALAAAALAGAEPGAELLDVPCGFGRHAVPLARAGYRVTGVDRSETQLAEARRASGDAEWPRLVQGDMRALPFGDASFDAVLCLFSSIGYVSEDDDRRTFGQFRRVLRGGGALVVETMHRDRIARIFRPRHWEELPDGAGLFLEDQSFDPVAGTTTATHTVVPPDGPPRARTHTLRLYTATEVVALLRGAGFERVECYGDLERAALSWDTRLVAVAR